MNKKQLKEEVDLGLGKDTQAGIVITSSWQEAPDAGDRIRVLCRIELPARNMDLRGELRFGGRCEIAGEALSGSWGLLGKNSLGGNCRYREEEFFATTWKEAISAAHAWGSSQLSPLWEALEVRRRALEDAGEWPEELCQEPEPEPEPEDTPTERQEGELWLEPFFGSYATGISLKCRHKGHAWTVLNLHSGEDGQCSLIGFLPADFPYKTEGGKLVIC